MLILVISLIFTGSIRAAIIICLVIPLSLMTAFLTLYLYGVPANLLSFGAVDFGIIVDAAVMIVEAILVQKLLAPPGTDFRELTRKTSQALGRPMLFAKLIFIVSLIPIFTFQRVEGRIFRPMALTITGAIVGATLMTLTLVPLAASFLLKGVKASHENFVARGLRVGYGFIMGYVLRYKLTTLLIALGVLGLSILWGAARDRVPAEAGRGEHLAQRGYAPFRLQGTGEGVRGADTRNPAELPGVPPDLHPARPPR